MATCVLCGNAETLEKERIGTDDLAQLYGRTMGLDVRHLFTSAELSYRHCTQCNLRFFSPPITGDESFYETLQQFEWYYLDSKYEYQVAARALSQQDAVLEIGCGKGAFAKYAGLRNYVGIEFNDRACAAARAEGINAINESVERHAQRHAEHYDVVCSFQVLEHVADVTGFINAAVKCLRPGGKLILAVPNYASYLRYAVNGALNMPPHHVTHWEPKTFEYLAGRFGLTLRLTDEEPLADIHRASYLSTLLLHFLRLQFGMAHRLIDQRHRALVFARFTSWLGRKFGPALPVEMSPHGHTITVVLEKTMDVGT